ncbi:hypothetical protein LguiA_012429 [Lonicera macranthoides]
MDLRDIGATLPPGFKFCPSDEELVCHYLRKKIFNEEDFLKGTTLLEIDLHSCEPWELPASISKMAPYGIKTGWVMHEFRLDNPHLPPKEDWVLCRVFYKAKSAESSTPQNGFVTTGGGGGGIATSSHYLASLSPPPTHHHQTTSFSRSSPHHNQNPNPNLNPSNINLPLQSPPNPSSLHVSGGINEAPIHDMFINSRCEENPYGYLFSVDLEDSRSLFEYCRNEI